jgi:hypothetical protein
MDSFLRWVINVLSANGDIVLGWVLSLIGSILGFVSLVLKDLYRDRRRNRAIKKATILELREVAHRLLGVVYGSESRTGGFDRKFLEWLHTQGKRYSDVERVWMEGVSGFLKSTEDELKKVATHLRESRDHSLSHSKRGFMHPPPFR